MRPDWLAREQKETLFHLLRSEIMNKFHQAKSNNLRSIPVTHLAEAESQAHQMSPDLPTYWGTCVYAHMHTFK